MSVFKTEWIVLRVGKTSQKEVFYTIFFREYGILHVTKKAKVREKPIDTGYSINCEIHTYNDKKMHIIANISILHFFESQWKSYSFIEKYLHIIATVKKEIPNWVPHYEIYDILSLFWRNQENISWQKLLLTHLKILSSLWNLSENHENITTGKILKFIYTNKYSDILRLWKIADENFIQLENIVNIKN